jgi:hypothetical protein
MDFALLVWPGSAGREPCAASLWRDARYQPAVSGAAQGPLHLYGKLEERAVISPLWCFHVLPASDAAEGAKC